MLYSGGIVNIVFVQSPNKIFSTQTLFVAMTRCDWMITYWQTDQIFETRLILKTLLLSNSNWMK